VNFVHNELVLEVRADPVNEASSLLEDETTRAFLNLFKPYKPAPVVRGLIEVGVGANCAHVK
jgi:hypothetical protein